MLFNFASLFSGKDEKGDVYYKTLLEYMDTLEKIEGCVDQGFIFSPFNPPYPSSKGRSPIKSQQSQKDGLELELFLKSEGTEHNAGLAYPEVEVFGKLALLAIPKFSRNPEAPFELDANCPLNEEQNAMRTIEAQNAAQYEDLAKLTDRTKMPITQENGQRRYGPPLHCTFSPPKGSEVFVGKLPRMLSESDIVPVFEQVGSIYEIRLMMAFSGTSRGYCFVKFFRPEEADMACRSLNHYEIIPGRRIGVTKSVDNCRLFVGGIPRNKTEQDILEEIRRVTDNVVRVISFPSLKEKDAKNRGFAFIEYESHKDAAAARRKMIPGKIQMWSTDVAVDWAEPERSDKDGKAVSRRPHPSSRPVENNFFFGEQSQIMNGSGSPSPFFFGEQSQIMNGPGSPSSFFFGGEQSQIMNGSGSQSPFFFGEQSQIMYGSGSPFPFFFGEQQPQIMPPFIIHNSRA